MGFKLRSGNKPRFKDIGSTTAFPKTEANLDLGEKLNLKDKLNIEKPKINLKGSGDKPKINIKSGDRDKKITLPKKEAPRKVSTKPKPEPKPKPVDLKGSGAQFDAKGNIVKFDTPTSDKPGETFIGKKGKLKTEVTDEDLKGIGQKRIGKYAEAGQFTGQSIDPWSGGNIHQAIRGRQSTHGIDPLGKKVKITEGTGPDDSLKYKQVTKDGLNRELDKTKMKNVGATYTDPDTGEIMYKDDAYVTTQGEGFLGLQNRKKYIDDREVTKEYKQEIRDAKKRYKQKKREDRRIRKEQERQSRKNPELIPGPDGRWMKNPNYIPPV